MPRAKRSSILSQATTWSAFALRETAKWLSQLPIRYIRSTSAYMELFLGVATMPNQMPMIRLASLLPTLVLLLICACGGNPPGGSSVDRANDDVPTGELVFK